MRIALVWALAIFVSVIAAAPLAEAACLHYEGIPVVLEGQISLRTFFGPPNYGEYPMTDSQEIQAIVHLQEAICVSADPADDARAEANQSDVTLVPLRGENLNVFDGQTIAVRGKLFHANTGHHHTPVLIQVERIQRPLNLEIQADGSIVAAGKSFSADRELEDFLRDYGAVRIHVLASKGVQYSQVEKAMKAIQASGGADVGLVGISTQ